MRNSPKRRPSNKRASAANFRHNVGKTHKFNMRLAPQRGGWRL